MLNRPDVYPAACNNDAIISASAFGHVEIVRLLMRHPRVDPAAQDNKAIKLARYYGHIAVVLELLKDSRVSIPYLSWRITLISMKIILGLVLLKISFPNLRFIQSLCISTALSICLYAVSSKVCRLAKLNFIL